MLRPGHALDHLLQQHVTRVRWIVPAIVLALAALHQALLAAVSTALPPVWQPIAAVALYTLTGSVVVVLGLTWLMRALVQRARAEAELQQAADDLARIQEHLRLLHDLGRQAANAADAHEVLTLAAQVPVDVLGARATAVVSLDGDQGRAALEMAWGLPDEAVAALRRAVDAGWPAEACSRCQPLSARVYDTCPLLTPLRAAGCAGGLQGVVCMPLGRGEQRQAVIASYIETIPPRERVQLLNIVATELAAALESVQLRSRRMATLAAVDQAAVQPRDLDDLLRHALDTLVVGWGAQAGAILLCDEADDIWTIRAHQGFGADLLAPAFDRVLRWAEEARRCGQSPYWPQLAAGDGLASAVVVLLATEGTAIGALLLGATRPETFSRSQAALLVALGHQLTLAVCNAQLSARVRQLAVLEERYRLAREMHDGLAQALGALGLELERVERSLAEGREAAAQESLRAARRAAADAYGGVREAIDGLRVAVIAPGGLAAALRDYAADFAQRTGLVVECAGPETGPELPPETALHLLRIAQEALTNVRRHAQAQRVWLRLAIVEDGLELSIADDGRGFDPALPRKGHHLGLATMRERARAVGATFTLATSPGQGTRVTVRLPGSVGRSREADASGPAPTPRCPQERAGRDAPLRSASGI